MLKKITIIASLLLLLALVFVIVGIVLLNSSMEKTSNDSDPIVKGDVVMPTKVSRPGCQEIDRCYIPSVITIQSGDQVTWVNEDSAFHSVTSGFYDAPSELFDSGHLDPLEPYTLDFDETGTFDYFCTLHPWMKGKVIVE